MPWEVKPVSEIRLAFIHEVRTFRATDGEETWDFGDGTPTITVHSDGNANPRQRRLRSDNRP